MPTYEYLCEKCGVFEVVQNMSDAPLNLCSEGHPVQRLISGGIYARKDTDQDWYWTPERRKQALDNNSDIAAAIGSGATVSNTDRSLVDGERQHVPSWLTSDLNSKIAEATGRTKLG